MTLGEIIKKYRSDNNLSMDEFSKTSGMSKAYISILERNLNPISSKPPIPSLDKIKSAGRAMGISLDEMLQLMGNDEIVSLKQNDEDTDISISKLSLHSIKVAQAYDTADTITQRNVRKLLDIDETPERIDKSIAARNGIVIGGKPNSEIDAEKVEQLTQEALKRRYDF